MYIGSIMGNFMVFLATYIFLWYPMSCLVIGYFGSFRRIGFIPATTLSFFLTPLIGAIFTASSPSIRDIETTKNLESLMRRQVEVSEKVGTLV